MKKILILGGNSDIGIKLIDRLLEKNNFEKKKKYKKKNFYKKNKRKIKKKKKNLFYLDSKNINNYFDNNYDIIVNLIGYVKKQSFLNFNIKEIQKTILINSLMPFLIIKNSLKSMEKKKYGRIINTSSIGVKFGGGSETFPYSISKHLNEFIPNNIRKLYSKNIYYNTLRIGVTNTKFHKKIKNKSMSRRVKLIPVKKMANTIDIVEYIMFLILKNNFITNEVITISGGE